MKKIKHKSISTLKKKAWTLFSLYIRRKGMSHDETNVCYTCGKRYHYKLLQAGHFIGGRHNNNLFDERGVRPQCYNCNINLKGNTVEFFRRMQQEVGDEVIDDLRRRNREPHPWTVTGLEGLIELLINNLNLF